MECHIQNEDIEIPYEIKNFLDTYGKRFTMTTAIRYTKKTVLLNDQTNG